MPTLAKGAPTSPLPPRWSPGAAHSAPLHSPTANFGPSAMSSSGTCPGRGFSQPLGTSTYKEKLIGRLAFKLKTPYPVQALPHSSCKALDNATLLSLSFLINKIQSIRYSPHCPVVSIDWNYPENTYRSACKMHQLPTLRILPNSQSCGLSTAARGASGHKEGPGGGGKAEPEECALRGCDFDITGHRLRQHLGACSPQP